MTSRRAIAAVCLALLVPSCGGDEADGGDPAASAPAAEEPSSSPKKRPRPPDPDPCSFEKAEAAAEKAFGMTLESELSRGPNGWGCEYGPLVSDETVLVFAVKRENAPPGRWMTRIKRQVPKSVEEVRGLGEAALFHQAFTGTGLGQLVVLQRPYALSLDMVLAEVPDAKLLSGAQAVMRAALSELD